MISVQRTLRSAILASALAFVALVPAAHAQTFTILHTFTGPDGAYPVNGGLELAGGKLYGTTPNGGDADAGVVFQLTSAGKEKVLYSFSGGSDGANPNGGVVHDPATGDIYGTAAAGGDTGSGVIFRLANDGTYSVLHSFSGGDGQAPIGGLIRDELGNLYGVTSAGGGSNNGTVFELTAGGTFSVLHYFNGSDGTGPSATLNRDGAGNLYGVTQFGGDGGFGTIFKVAPDGTFTRLYSFTGGTDGANPQGGLARDENGNLYGTATYGAHGKGTVFRLKPNGKFTVLYTFLGEDDGEYPVGDLLRIKSGMLYGTTSYGGGNPGNGTAYRVSPSGNFVLLHSFNGGFEDGAYPHAGLIKGKHGTYYGIAHSGGGGAGIVYSLTK